jgi:molecular chaperone GrpE (heat shock protein)
MPEDKIRVSARIPKELYDVCLQRYDNITNAINTGLALLCSHGEDNTKTNEDNTKTNEDNTKTNEDGSSRQNEDNGRQGDIQELKARVEEKDRHIESLKGELDNLRSIHNNYMLQVQTLINQKAIEAPGNKKPWYKFW